ncbi:hypothetical protein L6164_031824 [Bauhinia variegata]|uniref:Uncharacterized protein n=1 Tax=Bauhinia variegata TaxID=167791 RepID=A0ACB9KMH5_BAUVA|nr:hypothetical protein L6164_031824 [Bauhinia variegata]
MEKGNSRRFFFKRLRKESSLKFKLLGSAFKAKKVHFLPVSFARDLIFKVVSVFEAIVLVLKLSFFYLCCGCRF